MVQPTHIAIDAMGGDFGPRFCVSASLKFLSDHPHHTATLVGDESQLRALVSAAGASSRVKILHAEQVVEMADKPGYALRHKQESSMWKAVELVAKGDAQACVSAGNTGALMAMSCYLIKTIEGVSRPAICKPIPTDSGPSYLLDLGANIECSGDQLYQFALMGASLARLHGKRLPKVALLNVGTEDTKGGAEVQAAAKMLLGRDDIEFCGFLEGNALYSGKVDVIVCDGFTGNVALKVSEGVAKFAIQTIRKEMASSLVKRILAWPFGLILRSWWQKYNPALYNGAAFLGLQDIVVKSHGGADELGFYHAILAAAEQVESQVAKRIRASLDLSL